MATMSRRLAPWMSAVAGALMSLFFVIGPFAAVLCMSGILLVLVALLVGNGRGLWGALIGAGITPAALWGLAIIKGSPVCVTLPSFHSQSTPACRFTPEVYAGYWEAIALFLAIALVGVAIPLVPRLMRRTHA